MNYDNIKFARWNTIVSDIEELYPISIIDDGELLLTICEKGNHNFYRCRFLWSSGSYISFRNMGEYAIPHFWTRYHENHEALGTTLIAVESSWKEYFIKNGFLTDFDKNNLNHYVIITKEDIFEVLATKEPNIHFF